MNDDQPNPNRAVDSVTTGGTVEFDFRKKLDEFGAFCTQEGFTGSENAGDCANDLREELLAAYTQALTTARDCKAQNERLVGEVERLKKDNDFLGPQVSQMAKEIDEITDHHCVECGHKPPHESLNCPPLSVWDCLEAEKKFYLSATAELDRVKAERDALVAEVERVRKTRLEAHDRTGKD